VPRRGLEPSAAAGTGAMQSLRSCSNDRCLWLFLDKSRRHNRRWCDMRVCGNREKAKAFYARRKAR
jgi:predicted RNA-binding Zn ribbon-like protein